MKKILLLVAMVAGSFAMQAQGINFGIKAGANFSKFNGGDIDSENITNFHAGAVLELNIVPMFSVQAEGIFSSQGAKYDNVLDGAEDINLDYVSVPILAKFYILPNTLSLTAGPQFSFLVNDADDIDAKSTDIAISGGAEVKIIAGLFAQARYNIGVTKVSDNDYASDAKNAVFQLSVGYFF
ncbi:PorT family protein [Flavobacterium zepuense]|uniref:PorT family protein n=1 Tax=Flavobacterium zepuense TaxID=2593302 RepID=A0A552V2U2_9FLAO|nr:porin family protein [Flavobacterium zepuense]TRW24771.1 PorT family protein [Flavobacterium zepuense]